MKKRILVVCLICLLMMTTSLEAKTARFGITTELEKHIAEAILVRNQKQTANERLNIPEEPRIEKVVKNGKGDIRYVSPLAGLNLRESPTTNSPVIKTIKIGSELTVLKYITWKANGETTSKWLKVKTESGLIGYVSKDYVQKDRPLGYLGEFLVTYYCPCSFCCGWENGPTASGVYPIEGLTIAADPSIPFGTKLMIDGYVYTVQDRGGAIKGNHVDVFTSTHQKALSSNCRFTSVYQVY